MCPVVGYGTKELPAFYTRRSGLEVDYRLDSPEEIADMLNVQGELGLKSGILVTNPIPEEYSMEETMINQAINDAIREMDAKDVKGKECTPFLLARVAEITGGDSLTSNIQLVFNNAELAAKIAVSYCA